MEVVERAIAAINARDIDGYLACCTEDVVLRTPLAEITGAWDAWIRGDMDGVFSTFAQDVAWDLSHMRDWPEPSYTGHAGVRRFLTEWLEVWDAYEVGVDELIAAPDGRVVVLFWQRGIGRQSGLAMDTKWAHIDTVRDGKVVTLAVYDDRQEALKAVGLEK